MHEVENRDASNNSGSGIHRVITCDASDSFRDYTEMPPASLPIPAKRALPSKEASLFKELLTLYETRQLKKGLKTADLILKKFPEHGGCFVRQQSLSADI